MKSLTIEKALNIMKKKDEKRFPHIYGTYIKAKELAEKYNIDKYKVMLAAILHDYAKKEPVDMMIEIINKYLDSSLLKYNPSVYHGEVGSLLIQKDLGIYDSDIIL